MSRAAIVVNVTGTTAVGLRAIVADPARRKGIHFIEETNNDPRPFDWTADPDSVLAAVARAAN